MHEKENYERNRTIKHYPVKVLFKVLFSSTAGITGRANLPLGRKLRRRLENEFLAPHWVSRTSIFAHKTCPSVIACLNCLHLCLRLGNENVVLPVSCLRPKAGSRSI